MRLELAHAFFQDIVELAHFAHQFELFGEFQPFHQHRAAVAQVHAGFYRLLEDARDPGMGVLDIKNRILARLFLGEIQIEVKMAVRFAHQKKESRRVASHFFQDFLEGDELARAFAHAHGLAAARELHHLHQDDL